MSEGLIAAQLAVMAEVPYLQKRTSKELNYTFAGEADLIRAVRGAMLKNGLSIAPVGAVPIHTAMAVAKSGREMPHLRLQLTYRVSHYPSGEYVELVTIGEAIDMSDKAANKCMTIGLKYALRQFFLIETGDDPDVVAHFRDSENADWLGHAIRKIDACRTEEALDAQVERFRGTTDDGKAYFTAEQLTELTSYADKHRQKLTSKTSH